MMFTSQAELIDSVQSGEKNTMTIVEYQYKDKDGALTYANHQFSGQKRQVVRVDDHSLVLRNTSGVESHLDFEGDWNFRGRCLVVDSDASIITYIVNPII